MKLIPSALVSLAFFLLVGCSHRIEDKDFVGTWNVDPSAVAGQDKTGVMAKMTFNLTEDHSYNMSGPVPITVKGKWSYGGKVLTLTPATISFPNPMEAGKMTEQPVDALKQMQSMTSDESIKKSLVLMGDPLSFDVSDDGKKLTGTGIPLLIKAG